MMTKKQRSSLAWGIGVGVLYGLGAFYAFGAMKALPSVAFLFLVPAAMGAAPLAFAGDEQISWYMKILFAPWIAVFSLMVLLVLVAREGAICVLMLASPLWLGALVGTFIAWVIGAGRIKTKARKTAAGAALLLLPFAFSALEQRALIKAEADSARSRIVVHASAAAVWEQLAEVPALQADEYRPGFFQWLGVPRPIRATVDKAALGGHRLGEFEHGLRFQEVITAFEPPARMSFSIAVDPSTLRAGSAERHAFEAGYFKFTGATYLLTELGGGRTELQLSSAYLLESGVNWYGKLWARALATDFQERVLEVIRLRAERQKLTAGKQTNQIGSNDER